MIRRLNQRGEQGGFPARARLKQLFPSFRHFLLLLRVAFWVAVLPLCYRALSLPRLLKLLSPDRPVSGPDPEQMELAVLLDKYIHGLYRLSKKNIGRLCLRRSLILYRFLRLHGIPARFFVGVRKKEDGGLIGHSWITINGEHFHNTQADLPYQITFSYPEARPDQAEAAENPEGLDRGGS